jgi:hypothetical protein
MDPTMIFPLLEVFITRPCNPQAVQGFENVEIPLVVLIGWHPDMANTLAQILPPNPQDSTLSGGLSDWFAYRWRSAHVEPQLRRYLTDRKAQYLKRIELGGGRHHERLWTCTFEPTMHLCEELGIGLTDDMGKGFHEMSIAPLLCAQLAKGNELAFTVFGRYPRASGHRFGKWLGSHILK